MTTEIDEYVPLKGEGDVQYIKRTRCRKECEVCGEAADYKRGFSLHNARNNPASSGYGKDDISWFTDGEAFLCETHKMAFLAPTGYENAGLWTLSYYPHMGLYWRDEVVKAEGTLSIKPEVQP